MRRITTGTVTIVTVFMLWLAAAGGSASAASAPSSSVVRNGDSIQSSNAGYAVNDCECGFTWNGAPHSFSARWVEPKVVPRGYFDEYATFYVGFLDNFQDNSFPAPQVGTEADNIGGHAHYYAWYYNSCVGVFGSRIKLRKRTVRPGDHMSASGTVRSPDQNLYTLRLTDVRHRRHQSPLRWTQIIRLGNNGSCGTSTGVAAGVSLPGYGRGLLSDFGTVHFTDVKLNGAVLGNGLALSR
ncbi:MAG: hypothetical protein ACLP52_22265 [Streptosporangiaceae bacterium]